MASTSGTVTTSTAPHTIQWSISGLQYTADKYGGFLINTSDGKQKQWNDGTTYDYTSGHAADTSVTGYGYAMFQGNWVSCGSATVRTPAPPTPAPGAPSSLTGSAGVNRQIYLSWGSASGSVSGYRVWVYSNANGQWYDYGTTTSTSKTITVDQQWTNYPIYVVAYGPGGTSSPSNTINVRTSDDTPPVISSGEFGVTSKTGSSITVFGRASDSMSGVNYYNFYRSDGVPSGSPPTNNIFQGSVSSPGAGQNVSFTYSGLSAGYTYNLTMTAVDNWGNVSNTATFSSTTPALPDPPTAVYGRSSANDDKLIVVQWNMGANSSSVDIYYSLNDGAFQYYGNSNFTTVTVGGNAFYEVWVPSYGSYRVRFYGRNANGQSTTYKDTSYISIYDFTPPPTPSVSLVSVTADTIIIRASGGNSDVGSGWAGYQFYISVPPDTTAAYAHGGLQTGTDHTFTGLQSETAYLVGVRSKDNASNQSGFASLTVTTIKGRPTNFSWTYAKNAASDFKLTAQEWKDFCAKINAFRVYKLGAGTEYAFTTTMKDGDDVLAGYFNQASLAMQGLASFINTSLYPIPAANKVKNNDIIAAELNRMVNGLNTIT